MTNLKNIVDEIIKRNFNKALDLCEIYQSEINKHIILNFKGVIYLSQNEFKNAEINFLNSLKKKNNFIDPLNNLLQLYVKTNDFKKLLFYSKKLIEIDKLNPSFNYKLGAAYDQNNLYSEAIEYYEKCINLKGQEADKSFYNIGLIYLRLNKHKLSIKYLLEALKLDQNNKTIINHLFSIFIKLGDQKNSQIFYEKAKNADDKFLFFLLNKANFFIHNKRIKEGIKILKENESNINFLLTLIEIEFHSGNYKNAKKLIKENKEKLFNSRDFLIFYGMRLLYEGDYENGWKYYELRKSKNNYLNKIKEWHGETLKDKEIVVFSDQGIGDAIQFSKYLIPLSKISKKVTFLVKENIINLFEKKIPNLNIIKSNDNKNINFDFKISLGSLIKYFYKDKINQNILIKKLETKNSLNFGLSKKKLNIGIAWSGNFLGPNEPYRSIPLISLKKIFSLDINFYCLQNEIWERDLKYFNLLKLNNLGHLKLDEISSIIPQLDLVITTDTSFIHLSSSLNQETWGILNLYPEWRWGDFNKFNPYPSLKLFYQKNFDNWENVESEIFENLKEKINQKKVLNIK